MPLIGSAHRQLGCADHRTPLLNLSASTGTQLTAAVNVKARVTSLTGLVAAALICPL